MKLVNLILMFHPYSQDKGHSLSYKKSMVDFVLPVSALLQIKA